MCFDKFRRYFFSGWGIMLKITNFDVVHKKYSLVYVFLLLLASNVVTTTFLQAGGPEEKIQVSRWSSIAKKVLVVVGSTIAIVYLAVATKQFFFPNPPGLPNPLDPINGDFDSKDKVGDEWICFDKGFSGKRSCDGVIDKDSCNGKYVFSKKELEQIINSKEECDLFKDDLNSEIGPLKYFSENKECEQIANVVEIIKKAYNQLLNEKKADYSDDYCKGIGVKLNEWPYTVFGSEVNYTKKSELCSETNKNCCFSSYKSPYSFEKFCTNEKTTIIY
jgi:hypothetical protein